MTSRQSPTGKSHWGKILGAFFGFLLGHAVGAVFGILIGSIFDHGLNEHFSLLHKPYHQEKRRHIQNLFFTSTFAVMGHVAKADGRISEQEIAIAERMMDEMRLSSKQKEIAKNYFNQGKQKTFNLTKTLNELINACHDNRDLIRSFVDIQYQAATSEPLSTAKIEALNAVLGQLGFAPLFEQTRFYDDFGYEPFTYYSSHTQNKKQHGQSNRKYSSQQQKQHYYQQTHQHSTLAQAYAVLEISPNANKQEVKRAYRRLISHNHPDKLIAQGLPEAMIKLANNKTQQITKAYQQICTSKGW